MTKYNKGMFIWSGFMVAFNIGQWMANGCLPVWTVLGVAWWFAFGMFIYNLTMHIKITKEKK